MFISRVQLQQLIDERYISVQKHPDANLFIYNYTPKTQYANFWNEITLQCRGLILDENLDVVARPFPKFFNLEELAPSDIPDGPFEVYDKMDGSLGILYWVNNKPAIATRGSFIGTQALHATGILNNQYQYTFEKLDRNATYLFEIIYPANRIVINYGNRDDLVLLAIIDNKTGVDLPLVNIGFPIVKKYDGVTDFNTLKSLEDENREGFVVKFENGLRVKVKFDEYLRLHRIVIGVSNVMIWEHLAEGRPMDSLLENVPDEFYDWAKKIINDLVAQYNAVLADSKNAFKQFDTRKETAQYFQTQRYPAVLFAMLDGKPYDKIIWKLIKPEVSEAMKIARE